MTSGPFLGAILCTIGVFMLFLYTFGSFEKGWGIELGGLLYGIVCGPYPGAGP